MRKGEASKNDRACQTTSCQHTTVTTREQLTQVEMKQCRGTKVAAEGATFRLRRRVGETEAGCMANPANKAVASCDSSSPPIKSHDRSVHHRDYPPAATMQHAGTMEGGRVVDVQADEGEESYELAGRSV